MGAQLKAVMRDGLRLLKNWLAADISVAQALLRLLIALLIVCAIMVPIIYPLIGDLPYSIQLAICAALGVGFGIHQAWRPGAYLLLAATAGIFGGVGVLGAPELHLDLPSVEGPLEDLVLIGFGTLGLSLMVGFCGGLIAALGTGFRAYLILAVVAGIPIGLAVPNVYAALSASLLAGFATRPFRGRRTYLALTVLGPIIGAIVFSLALVLITVENWSWVDLLFGLNSLIVGVSVIIGQRLGHGLGQQLRQGLDEFGLATPYLRDMAWPLVGFTFVYFCIVVVFGALFASACDIYSAEKTFGFEDGQCKSYWHFLYLSMMTMSTLGHNDLSNAAPLIQTFIVSEVLIGIGWIVVVFAAIISYLEDKRSATRERTNQLERELKRVRDQLKEAQRNSSPE